ncbi:MAG TPA: hypothetical protein VL492_07910 [Methylovirgula sp.]|jgi:hypothetical protein|nr:hypothetical protein [Methylovirgula sp.]
MHRTAITRRTASSLSPLISPINIIAVHTRKCLIRRQLRPSRRDFSKLLLKPENDIT